MIFTWYGFIIDENIGRSEFIIFKMQQIAIHFLQQIRRKFELYMLSNLSICFLQ
jgi:hypothetical protein